MQQGIRSLQCEGARKKKNCRPIGREMKNFLNQIWWRPWCSKRPIQQSIDGTSRRHKLDQHSVVNTFRQPIIIYPFLLNPPRQSIWLFMCDNSHLSNSKNSLNANFRIDRQAFKNNINFPIHWAQDQNILKIHLSMWQSLKRTMNSSLNLIATYKSSKHTKFYSWQSSLD